MNSSLGGACLLPRRFSQQGLLDQRAGLPEQGSRNQPGQLREGSALKLLVPRTSLEMVRNRDSSVFGTFPLVVPAFLLNLFHGLA